MAGIFPSFDAPKPENDIDLIAWTREQMVNIGLLAAVEEHFDTHQFIKSAADRHSLVQRHLLNRYLNLQLILSGRPTEDLRFILEPKGPIEGWQQAFTHSILPFMVDNKLPRAMV